MRRYWLLALFLITLGGACAETSPTPPKRTVAIPTTLQERVSELALVSQSCSTEFGYITCEGFVRNISGAAIEDVAAVIIYLDENGTEVSSDKALIDYNPLLPDQGSPFKVMTRYNPAFKEARVEFQELFGGRIRTRDDSAQ